MSVLCCQSALKCSSLFSSAHGTPPGAQLFLERIVKLYFSFINLIKLKTMKDAVLLFGYSRLTLGLCIGKNLAIQYVSRYRGCDTICCDTISKAIYWDISYFRNRIYFRKAVIKSTPPYANLAKKKKKKRFNQNTVGSAFAIISPSNIHLYCKHHPNCTKRPQHKRKLLPGCTRGVVPGQTLPQKPK